MTSINIGPGYGYEATLLDPDNPVFPALQKNGAYFNGRMFLESYGDSPTTIDSYTHTISFWYKIGVGATQAPDIEYPILTNEDGICYKTTLEVYMSYNPIFAASYLNVVATGANIANQANFTVEVPTHDDTWHHILIYQKSWDGGLSLYTLYLDGTKITSGFTNESFFVSDLPFVHYDYWAVGAGQKSDTQRFEGCLDELYITFEDLDPDINNNIDKFINPSTGEPVPLGPNGNLPTGSAAYIYLTGEGANFATNYGARTEPFIIQGEIFACSQIFADSEVDPIIGYNSKIATIDIVGLLPTYSKTLS